MRSASGACARVRCSIPRAESIQAPVSIPRRFVQSPSSPSSSFAASKVSRPAHVSQAALDCRILCKAPVSRTVSHALPGRHPTGLTTAYLSRCFDLDLTTLGLCAGLNALPQIHGTSTRWREEPQTRRSRRVVRPGMGDSYRYVSLPCQPLRKGLMLLQSILTLALHISLYRF